MRNPDPSEFLVLPIKDLDLIAFFRGSDVSKPLYVNYREFIRLVSSSISPASGLLLQTNGTNNGSQTLLNLIQGSGITITDNGSGGITISASGGGSITADNGLTASGSNVQLGGATLGTGNLIRNSYITNDGFTFRIDQDSGIALYLRNTAASSGTGLAAITDNGFAVRARSTSGIAIEGVSADDYSSTLIRNGTDGTTVLGVLQLQRNATNTAFSGIGGAMELWIQHRTTGSPPSPTVPTATFEGIWSNPGPLVANRVGKFRIRLDLADVQQEIISGLATGQVTLDQYGSGTFTGTAAYYAAWDANGNFIEEPIPGGGSQLNETTGILFGGELSAAIGGTTFNLAEGIGQIVSQTSSISGVSTTITPVTWSTSTGISITNIATHQFTYILIDSSGTIVQQTTPFTDAQAKTHIMIGVLCHIDLASVNLVTNTQNVAYQDPYRLFELIKSFGVIKKNGLAISANGTNLSVDRTSGQVFKIGTNYITDEFQPDVTTMTSKTLSNLCRVYRNGSGGFVFDTNSGTYYTVIDPNNYDNGSGTLQSVGGNKWSIQRLFIFPNNPDDIICYYGIESYSTFAKARENLEIEVFDEATITQENAVFLGYLFVKNGATDLSDTAQALFLQSGSFRGIGVGGGGGGTSLSLETNGTPNGSQTLLNLVEGANMTITDDGLGNITFDAASGGGLVNIYANFDTGATLDQDITIDVDTEGTYSSASFSGAMTSATYEVNAVADTLPFTLTIGDVLTIIPDDEGIIKLSGTI